MKQELLENLIRVCVREILDKVNDKYKNDPEKIDPAKDTPPFVQPSPMTANVDEELKKVVKKMVNEFLKKR